MSISTATFSKLSVFASKIWR